MKKIWQIIGSEKMENKVVLHVPNSVNLEEVSACGQMLVDSDSIGFIYLLEKENEYVYTLIPKSIWHDCKGGLEAQSTFILTNGETNIELVQFQEELEYLVENIKGNGNYGDEMVKEVEAIFL
ncbi:hypothetical protein [Bacillus sp. B1-b2]|uniref:UPF0738 family protein n=1 Tax=Bacillus sp. B1-b2 TaxID=2653201 RepID=UPI001261D8CA|nr:hypothetical protein [Bacillus sp. B1-b2]KAB7667565.1 hypothetical protein F9279_14995 [Bacillus sp. B1-b2]